MTLSDGVDFVPTRPFYLLGPALQRDRRRRAHRRARSWPASSSAGCPASCGSASASSSSAPCTTSRPWWPRCATRGARSRRSSASRLGRRAWLAMMAFIWLALVYVILAFTDITASTFVGDTEDLAGMAAPFNQGGAVALASCLYLLLSVVMGFVDRHLRPPLWLTTVVFVPATLGCVWLGTQFSTVLVHDARTWGSSSSATASWPRSRRCGRSCSRAATSAASSSTWRSPSAWSACSSAASRRAGRRSRAGTRPGPPARCSRSCS